MKICKSCSISKSSDAFRKYKNRNKTYLRNECHECEKLRAKRYKAQNRELIQSYKIKSRYGLSKEEYNLLLSRYKSCAICNCNFKCTPHIDHDHVTNGIRGLLCPNCNKGLGLFRDNPAVLINAAKYLLSFEIEPSTTISKESTCKCMEAPSPLY